jgi:ferredoxin-NADP reductase
MARAAIPGRLTWQLSNVVETVVETPATKTIVLDVPEWPGHEAGQHVDVRLTAPDGYQAQRSYSIASPPESPRLELTVEMIDDGEVSPYLTEELRVGDELELRGPIGGYFVWREELGGPLQLIAGGSGIVPLRAMLAHRAAVSSSVPARLLYSARTFQDVIYRDELGQATEGVRFDLALTRAWPSDWSGLTGRVDSDTVRRLAFGVSERPWVYICGPTGFVEKVSASMVKDGHPPERIKTERFGPSGPGGAS